MIVSHHVNVGSEPGSSKSNQCFWSLSHLSSSLILFIHICVCTYVCACMCCVCMNACYLRAVSVAATRGCCTYCSPCSAQDLLRPLSSPEAIVLYTKKLLKYIRNVLWTITLVIYFEIQMHDDGGHGLVLAVRDVFLLGYRW